MNITNKKIILASGSPRRQQFLKELLLDFEIKLKPVEEIYPNELKAEEITDYLSQLKAIPFKKNLNENEVIITSDTIVWHNNKALGKPKNKQEAFKMLKSYTNQWHDVISSVCFTTKQKQIIKNYSTRVHFKDLTDQEIEFYIDQYQPFDKAGAYGIQEWIGFIGIDKIEGSYFNVVGLPCHLVYETIKSL